MDTVTHSGRTISYRHSMNGTDPTVCYIHGAGGSHRLWREQFDDTTGHPAVALDLSGHGDSDDFSEPSGTETLDSYADDVVSVSEETGATVLCGNSMGGAVALWIALERELRLDALVLTGSGAKLGVDPTFLQTLESDFETAIDTLHSPGTLFYEPTDDRVACSLAGLRAAGQAVTLRDFETCDAFDVRDRIGEIEVPTLVICGEHDKLTPPAFHEYLSSELPDGRYRRIADAAHMPMLERPETFNESVQTFLDSTV